MTAEAPDRRDQTERTDAVGLYPEASPGATNPSVSEEGLSAGGSDSRTQRWQVVVFVLGLVSAVATIWWQPWRMWGRPANWPALTQQALAAEEAGDYLRAKQLAEKVLASDAPPRWRAVAALVLAGVLCAELDELWLQDVDWVEVLASAEVKLSAQPLPETILDQINHWLQEADQANLPQELRPKWAYCKLWCQMLHQAAPSDWPQRLEQLLQESPSDRARGYERLVRWYLYNISKKPQATELHADWQAALNASSRLLVQSENPNPSVARLRHALLLLRNGRTSEAREAVARIPSRDPHYLDALYVLGQAWLAEHRYEEAAQAWNRLVQIADPGWPRLPQVLYWLGVCYVQGSQIHEADHLWQQLLDHYPQATWVRQATLLRLAMLRQARTPDNEVLNLLRQALHTSPLETNPYLLRQEVESWLQQIWQTWMEGKRFAAARELAQMWLNTAGKDSLLGKRWLAFALVQQAEQIGQLQAEGEELSPQDVSTMQAAYREAGELLEELARTLKSPNRPESATRESGKPLPSSVEIGLERLALLKRSALCFQRAQDFPRAIRLLEQALAELDQASQGDGHSSQPDALRQEMLVMLGESWHQLKLPQKAVEALQRALLLPGPHRVRGYYQLALAFMDMGKLDEAERALREILAVPVGVPETPEYRKALSALGHLHFRREQYETAAEFLDKAISRYPAESPPAYSLRYWLGECYRLAGKQEDRKAVAADTETRRQFHRQQKRKYLQRAAEGFDSLAQSLLARQKKQPLSTELAVLLRESRFALADCYFYLGEYEKAAALYENLGREHDRQLAGLRAWFEARRCYLAAGRPEDAIRAIEQASHLVEHLTDEDLAPTRMTRQQWVQFLQEARQHVRSPD